MREARASTGDVAATQPAGSDPTAPDVLAFTVGDVAYRWSDVHADARRSGDWALLETEVRQALSCLQVEADGPRLDRGTARAAEVAFRKARRLHAAEDLERWLAARGLTVGQWRRYIRGEALRHRHLTAVDVTEAHLDAAEVAAAMSVWGRCSGAFARWARDLAARAAGAQAACAHEGLPAPSPEDLAAHDELFDRFAAAASPPDRLVALIRSRYLDWLRLDCDAATFDDEDTAREALLCVRDDGWALEHAAQAGAAAVRRQSLVVEDAAEPVRHRLVGAREGDLLGPLPLGGGPTLLRVVRKRTPSIDDDELRARATRELVTTAAARAVDDRVKWAAEALVN